MKKGLNCVAGLAESQGEAAIIFRYAICGLLIAAGLATSSAAQTIAGEAGQCAGLPSFGPNDSLNAVDL